MKPRTQEVLERARHLPQSLFSIPTNIAPEDVEAARERDRAFLRTYKPWLARQR